MLDGGDLINKLYFDQIRACVDNFKTHLNNALKSIVYISSLQLKLLLWILSMSRSIRTIKSTSLLSLKLQLVLSLKYDEILYLERTCTQSCWGWYRLVWSWYSSFQISWRLHWDVRGQRRWSSAQMLEDTVERIWGELWLFWLNPCDTIIILLTTSNIYLWDFSSGVIESWMSST